MTSPLKVKDDLMWEKSLTQSWTEKKAGGSRPFDPDSLEETKQEWFADSTDWEDLNNKRAELGDARC